MIYAKIFIIYNLFFPNLSGRPTYYGLNTGIVWNHGQIWSEQRRFSLKHLRDLGFGRKSLDSVIVQEIDALIDKLLDSKDGIVEMKNTFNKDDFKR